MALRSLRAQVFRFFQKLCPFWKTTASSASDPRHTGAWPKSHHHHPSKSSFFAMALRSLRAQASRLFHKRCPFRPPPHPPTTQNARGHNRNLTITTHQNPLPLPWLLVFGPSEPRHLVSSASCCPTASPSCCSPLRWAGLVVHRRLAGRLQRCAVGGVVRGVWAVCWCCCWGGNRGRAGLGEDWNVEWRIERLSNARRFAS